MYVLLLHTGGNVDSFQLWICFDQDALYVFNNMVFFMLFVSSNLPSVFDLIKGGLSLNAAKHIGSLA